MAKRSSKADSVLIVLLVVVGIPLFLIGKVVESIGETGAIVLLIAILGFVIWYHQDKKKRLEYLRAKYDDESIVQKILESYIWQG